MDVKVFIPPILLRKRLKRSTGRSMQLYTDYAHAHADSSGYEDQSIIQVVSKKTEDYRNALLKDKGKTVNNRQTAQYMYVLSYIWHDSPLDVVEMGGACGSRYFELSHLLPGRIKSWHVVETPPMVAAGRRLFQDEGLSFHDDLYTAVSQLENLDLLIAGGVLQYTRNPLHSLETLLRLGFTNIYITRTIVGDNIEKPIITKQVSNLSAHGPLGGLPGGIAARKTSFPLTIIPIDSVKSLISVGYNISFSFAEDQGSMLIESQSITTKTVGFLLEMK